MKKWIIAMGTIAGSVAAIVVMLNYGGQAIAWLDIVPVLSRDIKLLKLELDANSDKINDNFKTVQAQIDTLEIKTTRAEFENLQARLIQNGKLLFSECQRYYELAKQLHYVVDQCKY